MTFIPGENEDREECRRKRKLLPTLFDDDDFTFSLLCSICLLETLKLEGETEKMGVCTKERKLFGLF